LAPPPPLSLLPPSPSPPSPPLPRHDSHFRCYCCCFLVDCCLPPLLPQRFRRRGRRCLCFDCHRHRSSSLSFGASGGRWWQRTP
jgi:hypothetical protein